MNNRVLELLGATFRDMSQTWVLPRTRFSIAQCEFTSKRALSHCIQALIIYEIKECLREKGFDYFAEEWSDDGCMALAPFGYGEGHKAYDSGGFHTTACDAWCNLLEKVG